MRSSSVDPWTDSQPIQECTKLAYALSKEIALFCNLSMGLGGVSDSDRLRDELRQSRDRACALAHENKIILLPLLKSTRKSSDTRGELERLYRLYSACLEFFEIQLLKVRSLLALFPLHTETCLFINTGIADPLSILSRATTCASKDSPFRRRRSSDDQKFVTKEKDELERIKKEAANIQEILYNVSSTVDIPPWEIIETTKQNGRSRSTSPDPSAGRQKEPLHVPSSPLRRRRVLLVILLTLTVLALLAIAIAVPMAMSKENG
ncbi:regulator of G-protein signaling 9-binding protein-like [Pomacea canaliculata]|uniref:regulator of G-protein signaling 9-binding protein-like n=1 Tax=Pomacea canaliculata TaxID=400727 RepID=UPI000D72CA10|nr:regulator of G-protein signaling 9-binding protein-like [Pomacea canaliculata]XP_025078197.1 regulator of G-protein signaling 9-binding protein-like [Pomacea canaliculata]